MALEVVPGDSIEIGCESIIRFAPMTAPVMHRMDVTMHYFFVPNRILWDNWEKFITNNGPNGTGPEYVAPYLSTQNFEPRFANALQSGSAAKTADYLGLPIPANYATESFISALPFAAYQCIYNEYYRDQNLITPIDYKLTDGNNGPTFERVRDLCNIRLRAWEHDYFTASLPFAQKGAAVDIPLGAVNGDANIYTNVGNTTLSGSSGDPVMIGDTNVGFTDLWAQTDGLTVEPTTINDLRRAYRLQEWLEKCSWRYPVY